MPIGLNKPTISQEQMTALLQHPSLQGKNPASVLAFLQSKGYSVDGYSMAKPKAPVTSSPAASADKQTGGLLNRVVNAPLQFAQGIAQGGIEGGLNMLSTAERAGRYFQRPFMSKEMEEATGMTKEAPTVGETILGTETAQKFLTPNNAEQKAGKVFGEVALPVVAGGAVTAPVKGTATMQNLLSKGGGLWGLVKRMGGNTALGLLETPVFVGSMEGRLPTAKEELAYSAFGGLLSGAVDIGAYGFKQASDGLTWLKKWMGSGKSSDLAKVKDFAKTDLKVNPEAAQVLTDLSKAKPEERAVFKTMIEDAEANMKNSSVADPISKLIPKIDEGFNKLVESKKDIGAEIGEAIASDTERLSGQSFFDKFKQELDTVLGAKEGTTVEGFFGGKQAELTKDSFTGSTIEFSEPAQNKIIEVYNKFKSLAGKEVTKKELWNLQQALDDILPSFKPNQATQLTEQSAVPFYAVISDMRNAIAPEGSKIAEAMKEYGAAADAVSFLNSKIGPEGAKGYSLLKGLFKNPDERTLGYMKVIAALSKEPSLVERIRLAKVAMDMVGNPKSQTLLGELVNAGAGAAGSTFGAMRAAVGGLLDLPEQRQIVMNILEDKYGVNLGADKMKQLATDLLKALSVKTGTAVTEELGLGDPEADVSR